MLSHIIVFLIGFVGMEWMAWAMHKYVMHGPLWILHQDHHTPRNGYWWQRNDFFALFFATPSFLLILFGSYWFDSRLASLGYGIMAYGMAYFMVHEVLIHRRLKFIELQHWYFLGLIQAHRDHHKIRYKYGCKNFGMLIVPWQYFKFARAASSAKTR